jgi:hypothetical protein
MPILQRFLASAPHHLFTMHHGFIIDSPYSYCTVTTRAVYNHYPYYAQLVRIPPSHHSHPIH